MVRFKKFLGLFLNVCLMLDEHLLKTMGKVISSLFRLKVLRQFSPQVLSNRIFTRHFRLIQRGFIYSFLLLFAVFTSFYCSKGIENLIDRDGSRPQIVMPAPSSFEASFGEGQITLSWDAVPGASHYKIYRNDELLVDDIEGLAYTDSDIEVGTLYSYQMSAVDADGNEGERSVSIEVRLLPDSPVAPGDLSLSPGDRQATLSWKAVAGADYYRVYRAKGSQAASRIADNVEDLQYVDTGLTNGDRYGYQVSAVIDVGDCATCKVEGSKSGRVSGVPAIFRAGVPSVSASSGDRRIKLSWNAVAGATSYKVYSVDRDGNENFIQTVASGTSYTAMGLTNGVEYRYRVSAFISGSEGDRSDTAEATPIPNPPAAPENLRLTAGDMQITLIWEAVLGVSYYRVYRAAGSQAASLIADNVGDSRYVDTGLENDQTYTYQVSAVIDVGDCSGCKVEGAKRRGAATPNPRVITERIDDPAYYTDPFAFTGNSFGIRRGIGTGVFDIRSNPGAAWPNGMTQMAPINIVTNRPWSSVIEQSNGQYWTYTGRIGNILKGFSTGFITGPGCQIGNDFPFIFEPLEQSSRLSQRSPGNNNGYVITNRYAIPDTARSKKNVMNNEYAEPGYYRVQYKHRRASNSQWVRAEFTVTPRTGVGKFTFPSSAVKATALLTTFDALRRDTSALEIKAFSSSLAVRNAVTLKLRSDNFCQANQGKSTIYAVFVFDTSFTVNIDGNKQQANLVFNIPSGKVINMKVGKSSSSAEQAYRNILSEQSTPGTYKTDVSSSGKRLGYNDLDWDFSSFRPLAYKAWNSYLSRISMIDEEGSTTSQKRSHRLEEKRIFYSALYQTSLHPNIYSDYNGQYMGLDNKAHNVSESPPQEIQYQNYSGWDTYRGQHQLISLLDKKIARDTAQSLINNAYHTGCTSTSTADDDCYKASHVSSRFTKWGYRNSETGVMNGDPGVILVASSLAYGGEGFDYEGAFQIMKSGYGTVIFDVADSNPGVSVGNFRGYRYTNGSVGGHGRTIFPKGRGTWVAASSNLQEFAAGDFAKAQFLRNVKQLGSGEISDSDLQTYYGEFMNHAGDTWKKAYMWYKSRHTSDYVVRDINGIGLHIRDRIGVLFGSVSRLGLDYITARDATSSKPNLQSTWNQWHSYLNNFHLNGYSYTPPGQSTITVPRYCSRVNCSLAGFVEGEPEHYVYMVPFDIKGLFKVLGPVYGADATKKFETYKENGETFVKSDYHFKRLKHFIHYDNTYNNGERGHNLNFGNQPCYTTPWALNYTGKAHFLQMTMRRIQNFITDDTVNKSLAGNDDLGSLTSQYVWESMGLYPAHPGLGVLHVTSPRFKKMIVRDEASRVLIVSTAKSEGAASKTCNSTREYNTHCFLIDSMKKNGQNYTKAYIRYYKDIDASISSGGLKLEFNLHKLPQANRGLGNIDRGGNFVPNVLSNNVQRNSFYGDYEAFESSTKFGKRLTDLPPSGSGGIRKQDDALYYSLIDNFSGNSQNLDLTKGVSQDDYNSHGDFSFNHEYY